MLALLSAGAVLFLVIKSGGQSNQPKAAKTVDEVSQRTSITSESQVPDADDVPIDTQKSVLAWNAKRIIGTSNHNGTVGIKEGSFKLSGGEIVGGDFVIDMTTLRVSDEVGGARLESHLRADDFFDVGNYPEAKLSIKEIKRADTEGGQFNVVAELTIKGITNEIMFPAEINQDGTAISADANFSIDRTRWDVKYESRTFFGELGDRAIDDMINFNVQLES